MCAWIIYAWFSRTLALADQAPNHYQPEHASGATYATHATHIRKQDYTTRRASTLYWCDPGGTYATQIF